MMTTYLRTTDRIGRATMSSRRAKVRGPAGASAARRAASDRVFVYWAVGSGLLVFLALILTLVISGKLRSLTAAVDRQTGAIDSLSARVRALETDQSAAGRMATSQRRSPIAP